MQLGPSNGPRKLANSVGQSYVCQEGTHSRQVMSKQTKLQSQSSAMIFKLVPVRRINFRAEQIVITYWARSQRALCSRHKVLCCVLDLTSRIRQVLKLVSGRNDTNFRKNIGNELPYVIVIPLCYVGHQPYTLPPPPLAPDPFLCQTLSAS